MDTGQINSAAKAIAALNLLKIEDKHRRFADIYIEERSAPRAYRLAKGELGAKISEGTAKQMGYLWLHRPEVQTYMELAKIKSELEAENTSGEIDPARVLQEEAYLAFSDLKGLVDENGNFIANLNVIPEATRRALASVKAKQKWNPTAFNNQTATLGAFGWEVEYKMWDKGQALARLEKALGLVNDAAQVKIKLSFRDILLALDGTSRGILPADMEAAIDV